MPNRKSKFIWNKIPSECLAALDQQLEAINDQVVSRLLQGKTTSHSQQCSLANFFSSDDVTIKEKKNQHLQNSPSPSRRQCAKTFRVDFCAFTACLSDSVA